MSPVEAFIELALASNGALNVDYPILNHQLSAVEEMLDMDLITLGLADAGAHIGQIMDTSQPTFLLTYWVHERQRWTLERAIRRLTSDTADLFGFKGRGRVQVGNYADLNVIDFDAMSLPQPPSTCTTCPTVPAGTSRARRGTTTPSSTARCSWTTASTSARSPAASCAPPTDHDRPITAARHTSQYGDGHGARAHGRRVRWSRAQLRRVTRRPR